MTKFLSNMKTLFGALVLTAVVGTSTVSCTYDDADVRKQIQELREELAALRDAVRAELNSMKELLEGNLMISDIERQSDGSTVLVLSDGTRIKVPVEGAGVPNQIVTVTTIDGVRYWAMYSNGVASPIYVNGEMVPVADADPETRINSENNTIEVSFDGGVTWIQTGYTQSAADTFITDIRVVYSDWQVDGDGNPIALYCELTLIDGSVVKIGMQNGKLVLPVDSMFVAFGTSSTMIIDVEDAADYMTQVPEGWECSVDHRSKDGKMYITFDAPTYEAIESGAAVREGVFKMMIVFNNGSSAIASIKVSTNPANVYFTEEGVYFEVGYGTSFLVAGVIGASSYDPEKIVTNCTNYFATGSSSTVHGLSFMEELTMFVPYSELRTTALTAGSEYILWYAAPSNTEEGDMVVAVNDLCALNFVHVTVDMKVTSPSFFDVNIKFTAKGVDENRPYMIGYELAENFDAAEIATYYTENPDYLYCNRTEGSYTGSFLEMFDPYTQNLQPGVEYTAWCIVDNGSSVILPENVYNWTFSTSAFTEGGVTTVEASDVNIDFKSFDVTLDTDGHIAMYYAVVPSYMASAYPEYSHRLAMLLREGTRVFTTEAVRAHYQGTKAGEELVLYAVAVDANGKYGEIFVGNYATKAIEYNGLTPTLEVKDIKIDDTRIGVSCDGAVSYLYIYTMTDTDEWTSRYGGSVQKAGEYIMVNPTGSGVYSTADERYALQDGAIVLSGLSVSEDYIIVVAAVDAEGGISAPVAAYFTPIANIGNVIYRDDPRWEASKPTVEILELEDNPHLFMSFSWSCLPAPHTTVYTAAMFPDNFINVDLGTNIDTVEKLIAEIIVSCDTGTMSEQGKSFAWQESGIYVREWTEWKDLDNDGYLEEVDMREERSAPYIFYPYGSSENTYIYTTWVGEDGNFCEPFAFDPLTETEMPLWR